MGLYGHMDNIVSGVVDAANNSEMLTGIGITPEGSQNNPVLYDLLFETVWCDDATKTLTEIDTDQWLKDYVTRRYGAKSESAYEAMKILENTVYKASLNMRGQPGRKYRCGINLGKCSDRLRYGRAGKSSRAAA